MAIDVAGEVSIWLAKWDASLANNSMCRVLSAGGRGCLELDVCYGRLYASHGVGASRVSKSFDGPWRDTVLAACDEFPTLIVRWLVPFGACASDLSRLTLEQINAGFLAKHIRLQSN